MSPDTRDQFITSSPSADNDDAATMALLSYNESSRSSNASLDGAPVEDVLPDYVKALVILLYTVVIVVAFGGNVTVCCIVAMHRGMHTVTNLFIVSLSCSDILMATLCIPMSFVANVLVHYWPFGRALCPVVLYAQTVAVFLSAFTMLAISLDRYRAVIFPLRPRLTIEQSIGVISITWSLALIVSLPVAVFARVTTRGQPNVSVEPRDFCDENWPGDNQRYAYSIVVMILQYFLPLLILLFTYVNIGVVIWAKRAPGEAENARDQRFAASKRKMVKMMITVVVIYALCWLPLHTITLVGDAHAEIWKYRFIQPVWIACHWLAMSNSCYNPIVYCWMSEKFRAGFYQAFRWCPCVRRRILYAARLSAQHVVTGRYERTLTPVTSQTLPGDRSPRLAVDRSPGPAALRCHVRYTALDPQVTSLSPYSSRRTDRSAAGSVSLQSSPTGSWQGRHVVDGTRWKSKSKWEADESYAMITLK